VAHFLGIDGGGSKTSCLIGDETSILGGGTSGGSNPVRVGEAQARDALATAIRQACVAAKLRPSQIQNSCIGLAGAARPEIRDRMGAFLAELVPGEIEIVGDMVIALEAAFGSASGLVVIAGTGSMAYGRNSRGETARAGGWGFAISDEGSGHWIGRATMAAAMRALDRAGEQDQTGDANGSRLEKLMKSWQVGTREQLVLAANATPPPDFAALFPTVLSMADQADPIARTVLNRAGEELAELARTVIMRLFAGASSLAVAMSGGIFSGSPLVRQVFCDRLRSEYPEVAVHSGVIEPVRGALELARKGARK
jgi:glucosamine kinase